MSMVKKNASPLAGTEYLVIQAKLEETSPRDTELCAGAHGLARKDKTGRIMMRRCDDEGVNETFQNGQSMNIFPWKSPH